MGVSRCETTGDPIPLELGRYRIEGPLGRGGMGVVHQGRDTRLGRVVAIKMLPERLARDAESLARFEREARVLAGLHHPNIAAIHGVGRDPQGGYYLVLERVEGETLAARLARGPLPIADALDVGRQVARALVTAHEREVVHRDLKPSNVMLTPTGLAKVLDFGLARQGDDASGAVAAARDDASGAETYATLTGLAQGTPGYMSPEQILGDTAAPSADAFSLGCLLYECLTGRRTFPGRRVSEVIDATLETEPDWTALPRELSEAVGSVLRRCLAKDPRERPTASEIERELADPASQASERVAGPAKDEPAPIRGLPELPTRFVGREREIRECVELLGRSRLLTLTGGGGSGKTRLAIRVADELHGRDPQRVWFCDLAPVGDGDRVPHALAAVLGVPEGSGQGIGDALVEHLEGAQALIVLDNCEHVLRPAAELARELLARCPRLRLLATSREWLGVPGEQTYRVPSLSLPAPESEAQVASALRSESVRLFLDRATRARADFRLVEANVVAVSRLCRRLDGIPLAIELAASRMRTMDVQDIEAQLDPRQASTGDGARAPAANPMEAAIRWSYGRLDDPECRLLRGLSVFAGGATLDAASAVCGEGRDAFEVLDLLTGLVDQSLLTMASGEDPESRYRMLEPVREFALGELKAAGEESPRRDACLDYYLALGEAAAPALPGGPKQARWLARLEAEHESLLAALDWCERAEAGAAKALRLAGSCWMFWFIRGHFAAGRRALERALGRPEARGATAERALALFGAGGLAVFQGDPTAAETFGRECLEIYRQLGDRSGVARATVHLALAASERNEHEAARSLYEQALAIYRELGESRGTATTLNNLGVVARCRGDYRAALGYWEEALGLARRGENQDTQELLLVNLALASTRLGETKRARGWLAEGLRNVARMGARRIATAALEVAGEVLCDGGAPGRAATLYGAADALRESIRLPADEWWRNTHQAVVARIRSELGEDFEPAWARGRQSSMSAALEDAQRWVQP